MALAFVKETSATETTAATTLTLTPANTIGNLLVLSIAQRPTSTTVSTVADTGGNTWTLSEAGASLQSVYYSLTTAVSGTLTVTMSAASSLVLSCLEFSGVAASSFTDVKAISGTSTANNAPTLSTATTANANDVVVAWVQQQVSAPTFSAQTAGYTVQTLHGSATAQPLCMQAAYKIVAATGTQTYGLSSTSSAAWTVAIVTFKASGSSAITGTGAGVGTATATWIEAVAITATGAGAGTGTAALQETAQATGTGAGVGTGTAAVLAKAAITGTGAGVGSATAAIGMAGVFQLTGTGAGRGSGTATVAETIQVTGTGAGAGDATAAIAYSLVYQVNGTGAGRGTATAAISYTALFQLTGTGAGAGTGSAIVTYVAALQVTGTGAGIGGGMAILTQTQVPGHATLVLSTSPTSAVIAPSGSASVAITPATTTPTVVISVP